MSDTLIVSTWGSPSRWGCAEYVDSGRSVLSCCTLPLLTSKYKGSDAILIVLDSLVEKDDDVIERYRKSPDELSTCGLCYAGCWSDRDFNSYEELEAYVKDLAEHIVKCIYRRDLGGLEDHGVNVIVSPGVGSPGRLWAFKGGVGDFMGKVLLETGLILDKLLEEGRSISRIVLDLTHGINFMPSATLYLARMISSLLLVRQFSDVEIEVYNSDPYPQRTQFKGECYMAWKGEVPTLNLNLVYKESVKSVYVPSKIPDEVIKPCGDPGPLRDKLGSLRRLLSSALYVVSSIYYPLPLLLVYSCQDFPLDDVSNMLKEILEIWRGSVKIAAEGGRRTVDRSFLELQVDSIYSILLAYFTCKSVRNIVGDLSSEYVSLKSLEELGKLYGRVSEINKILLEHEQSQIKKDYEIIKKCMDSVKNQERAETPECKMIIDLMIGDKVKCVKIVSIREKTIGEQKLPDKRIMVAHAGFQKYFTEICIDEAGNPMLKYSDDLKNHIKEFKKVIKKASLLLQTSGNRAFKP